MLSKPACAALCFMLFIGLNTKTYGQELSQKPSSHWLYQTAVERRYDYLDCLVHELQKRDDFENQILLLAQSDGHDNQPIAVIVPSQSHRYGKINFKAYLVNAAEILTILHALRYSTETDRPLYFKGKFWSKWYDAFAGLTAWDDGDKTWSTNVRDHGFEGAMAYMAFLKNYPRALAAPMGFNKEFMATLSYCILMTAGFSFEFELGPFSEATFGRSRRNTSMRRYQGWTDLVLTELVGALIANIERWNYIHLVRPTIHSPQGWKRVLGQFAAVALCPSRSVVNGLNLNMPGHDWGER